MIYYALYIRKMLFELNGGQTVQHRNKGIKIKS